MSEVESSMRERGGFASNSPDVFTRTYEKFGIDDARKLCELSAMKSSDGHSLYIVATVSMTTEAQQALLKLFEEPQIGAVFVLIIPHGTVLPTLRSRCMALYISNVSVVRKDSDDCAQEFLRANHEDRSAIITKIVKEYEDNRAVARDFLDALERAVYKHIGFTRNGKELVITEALSDIALFRGYLSDKAPSVKMIFEHLAASLPCSE